MAVLPTKLASSPSHSILTPGQPVLALSLKYQETDSVDPEVPLKGDAWGDGYHVCFPSLQPVLECGLESPLGLEFSGFSIWHLLKLVRDFPRVLRKKKSPCKRKSNPGSAAFEAGALTTWPTRRQGFRMSHELELVVGGGRRRCSTGIPVSSAPSWANSFNH